MTTTASLEEAGLGFLPTIPDVDGRTAEEEARHGTDEEGERQRINFTVRKKTVTLRGNAKKISAFTCQSC